MITDLLCPLQLDEVAGAGEDGTDAAAGDASGDTAGEAETSSEADAGSETGGEPSGQ